MALPGQMPPRDVGLPGGSFRSSFGSLAGGGLNPHALSFTSRSMVGTLDAENPFGPPSTSFNAPASFLLPPPDQATSELYQTLPLVTPSAPSSPPFPGDTLVNTATAPVASLSVSAGVAPLGPALALGTATGPAGMAPLTLPATGAPSTTASMALPGTSASVQLLPLQSLRIPGTASLPPGPSAAEFPGMVTFASVPGAVAVPPTAPTFASVPVVEQAPLASVPAMPGPGSASSQHAVGSQVEYLSDKSGSWITAVVQGYNSQTGEYALDVDPRAPPGKVRPLSIMIPVPTPPASGIVTIAAKPQAPSAAPAPPPPPIGLVPNITITPVAVGPTPPQAVSTVTAQQSVTLLNPMPATGMTTTTAANPFGSSATLNPFATAPRVPGPTQSVSSSYACSMAPPPGVAEPAMEPITQPAPPVTTGAALAVQPLARTRVSSTVSEPVVSSMTLAAVTPAISRSAEPQLEPILAPPQPTASVVTEPPSASAYAAQGDPYLAPPDDVWLALGQPTVRVEPNWRDGQWWYTTAVDFKGLEKLPLGSKQESLLIADEALVELEERGEIPPLPAPGAWSETDTCPIT